MFDERYTPVKLDDTNLFKPLKLNDKITLQHRAVMVPLTRKRADDKYVLKQDLSHWEEEDWKQFAAQPENNVDSVNKKGLVTEYYHQRSIRPGTLIIAEATFISGKAGGYENVPGIWNDEQAASLKKVIDAIHANKSYMFVQLWNLGRQADPIVLKNEGYDFLSASEVYPINDNAVDSTRKSKECGNPLKACTIEDIEDFKRDYLVAARNAFKAGADGVEIHAANGYLINQFIDVKVNKRTDQYGPQSFENRSRFLFEVLDSMVAEFGADRVAVRLSPFGTFGDMSGDDAYPETIQMYTYIYQELEKRRLAGKGPVYLSIVEPRVTNPFLTEGEGVLNTVNNEFLFDHFKGVVLRAGNMVLGNKFTKKIIDQNDRTLAGFGRYWIANPDLVDRLEKELPLNKYDRNTFYADTYRGYIDYPFYKE